MIVISSLTFMIVDKFIEIVLSLLNNIYLQTCSKRGER